MPQTDSHTHLRSSNNCNTQINISELAKLLTDEFNKSTVLWGLQVLYD